MDDLIRRQDVIDTLNKMKRYRVLDSDEYVISDCLNNIVNLPSAQTVRRTGRWIDDCTCSNCHWTNEDSDGFMLLSYYDFCPSCGADMRGGDVDD